jgi:hypothetical protein
VLPLLFATSIPATATAVDLVRCYAATEVFPDAVRKLSGDVDGDRSIDTAHTRASWVGPEACRARLVVDTGTSVLRVAIDPSTGIMIGPPGLAGLVDLSRHPGLEVAVVVWRGASTGFLQLYGVDGGRLTDIAGESFGYAGSVVHPSGVDCARKRGAVLVRSKAEYLLDDDRYHVERMFYAFRGNTLQPVPALTERLAVRPAGLARFPELAGPAPFPSCTVVLGAS